jgi:hypothetical protein
VNKTSRAIRDLGLFQAAVTRYAAMLLQLLMVAFLIGIVRLRSPVSGLCDLEAQHVGEFLQAAVIGKVGVDDLSAAFKSPFLAVVSQGSAK